MPSKRTQVQKAKTWQLLGPFWRYNMGEYPNKQLSNVFMSLTLIVVKAQATQGGKEFIVAHSSRA